MTSALFLAELPESIEPDAEIVLDGPEGHHAVAVKRITPGEEVIVANGAGYGVRAVALTTGKAQLTLRVQEVLHEPKQALTWAVAQAIAKGERSELAVQMITELGASVLLAWQAERCVVRLRGDREEKLLRKWRATAREATKQSRRLRIPEVRLADTAAIVAAIKAADVALVAHEAASSHVAEVSLPATGSGIIIVGPEGGISPGELDRFTSAGAQAVSISDAVLRTSTAAAVALGQVDALRRRR